MAIRGEVETALITRIGVFIEDDAIYGLTGRIEWPGYTPEASWENARHARVEIDMGTGERKTVGGDSGIHEYQGTLTITLWEPAGDGNGALTDLADAIDDLFRNWHTVSPQIEMGTPAEPITERDGANIRIRWACPFFAFADLASAT